MVRSMARFEASRNRWRLNNDELFAPHGIIWCTQSKCPRIIMGRCGQTCRRALLDFETVPEEIQPSTLRSQESQTPAFEPADRKLTPMEHHTWLR
jgi:hypothetical protein